MKIGIATDHRGVETKQEVTNYLNELGYTVVNYGTDTNDSVDYPLYAFKIGEAVVNKEVDYGVLICGTGIGMSIACNKVNGIRCAKVSNAFEAKMTRIDNDANVLALGHSQSMNELKEIIKTFFETEHPIEERHDRRISLVDKYNG
jgi:sugar-phosphate isomerases, RpiB/LacA/LacB family